MSFCTMWYHTLSKLVFAHELITFCELMSGLAVPLKLLVSIVVDAVLLTCCAPITFSYVPLESDSLSARSILYMVTLQVPAVPLAPLNLTFPLLMSAANVAKDVFPEFVVMLLYCDTNASEPLCTSNTSTFCTSLVVVLLMDT